MQFADRKLPLLFHATLWSGCLVLLGAATLAYLLDPNTQQFERLEPLNRIRHALAPWDHVFVLPTEIRFWFADAAWAALAALFTAELLHGMRIHAAIGGVLIVGAATSWELLQATGVVRGVFDPQDLLVSLLAGVFILACFRIPFSRDVRT